MALCMVFFMAACAPSAGTKADPVALDAARPVAAAASRPPWWNHYASALEAVDREDYTAAQTDLAIALKLRNRDQRLASTAGRHYIDYFPHRELGVVHWLRGDLVQADAELSLSLKQEPTAKARYYLDLVRKARIKQMRAPVKPPQLALEMPSEPIWSRADQITVKGRAADPSFISDVLVDGQSLHLEGGRAAVDFSHDLSLPQGCHAISVEAVNLVGQRVQKKIKVCVDRLGPSVILDRIESQADGYLLIGSALDAAGVSELKIADRRFPASGKKELAFSLRLPPAGRDTVIECLDVLGNRTVFHFNPTLLESARTKRLLLAGLQLSGLFPSRDDRPPELRIPGWQKSQTVYLPHVALTGSVSDQGKIVSLSINGEPLLPKPGALFFFAHIVDLSPGENTVVIEAEDAAGNRSQRRLMIERKIPKGLMLEERLRLSVFAFEQKGRISPAAYAFQDDFIHAIIQHRRFQVVERQRLDLILQEHKINRTQLIDTGTAVRLGNLAAAQAIVAGSLVETRNGVEIVSRVIDTETAEILCTADVYGENKTLPGLKFLARALALKLLREFPLVEGQVIDKRGDTIITDLTLGKLRAQRRILIYAEHPVIHPDTNQSMGMDHEVLGGAHVTQADGNLAKARLRPDSDAAIQPRHRVITQ